MQTKEQPGKKEGRKAGSIERVREGWCREERRTCKGGREGWVREGGKGREGKEREGGGHHADEHNVLEDGGVPAVPSLVEEEGRQERPHRAGHQAPAVQAAVYEGPRACTAKYSGFFLLFLLILAGS